MLTKATHAINTLHNITIQMFLYVYIYIYIYILGVYIGTKKRTVRFSTHGLASTRTPVQLKSDNASAIWFAINNMWNKQDSANVCFCWWMRILASQYITTTAKKKKNLRSCSMRVYSGIWAFIPSSPGCWWRENIPWKSHTGPCLILFLSLLYCIYLCCCLSLDRLFLFSLFYSIVFPQELYQNSDSKTVIQP